MNRKEKHEIWLNNLLNKVSKQDLEDYYFSHRKPETCKHFGLPNSAISFLLKYYNITKPVTNIINHRVETSIEVYGANNPSKAETVKQKRVTTCLEKYNAVSNLCTDQFKEQSKQKCLEKYGTEFANQDAAVKDRIVAAKVKHYGSIENCYLAVVEAGKETRAKNYGSIENSYKIGLENQSKIIQEKYNVPYACMRPEARNFSNNSKPNQIFARILEDNGFIFSTEHGLDNNYYSREFNLNRLSYDFKIGTTLVEINPSATHNSTWGLFDKNNKLDIDYHFKKSKLAKDNGYRCIQVFDWDDQNKILSLIKNKIKIYARQCELKEVPVADANKFLNLYHLQNTCRNQTIRLGLYYNNELVELMTFGKPRYNKKYEYELLRLCTRDNLEITAGASKLFTYFLKEYNPASIISYCDLSKFNGNVYEKLGFNLEKSIAPSLHWYNIKTKQHITNNLLMQQGFDRLFGTNYGKGTSNRELMLNNNFVEIYDCGQATYIYNKLNK